MKRFLYSLVFLSAIFIAGTACKSASSVQGGGLVDIKLNVDSSVDLQKVRVEWISPNMERTLVVDKGIPTNADLPAADKDVFEVYVGTRVIGGGGADRAKGNDQNEYQFSIGKEKKAYQLGFNVIAPDSVKGYYLKRYVRDLVGNISRIEFYNQYGLKTHEKYDKLSRTGELEASNLLEYKYDSEGRKLMQVHTSTSPEGELISKTENKYAYNSEGREIETQFVSYGKNAQLKNKNINRFKYNDLGLLSEKEFLAYNADGEKVSHFITEYKYNDKGYNIEDIQYNGDGRLMNRLERDFNDVGTIVKEAYTEYRADGSVKGRHGREYDDKGNILKEF